MAVVRLESLRGLKAAIESGVPELIGHVVTGQVPPGAPICFPSLAIDPIRFRYEPAQALEVFDPEPGSVVVNVGRFVTTVQLRLEAATLGERYELEEKVLGLFLGTPLRPGILLTEITACTQFGNFVAAWELDEDSWENEKAFSSQYGAVMALTGLIPALATQRDVYTIQQLQLGISNDFTTQFTASTFGNPPTEVVQINQDGTFTRI